jgi:hypothetical protein
VTRKFYFRVGFPEIVYLMGNIKLLRFAAAGFRMPHLLPDCRKWIGRHAVLGVTTERF